MSQYYAIAYSDEYLEHFGVKGQKWGIRKYQNEDGTLTEEGKARYGKNASSIQKGLNKLDQSKAEYIRDTKAYSRNSDYGSGYSKKKVEQTNKAVKQLLDIAKKNNYSITEIQKNRSTGRGERLVSSLLFGAPGLVTSHLISKYVAFPIAGTKYEVRDRKKG